MNLLHIDSSILGENSASRGLSAAIVNRLLTIVPDTTVTYRDLAVEAALHLSGAHLAAWQGAPVASEYLGKDLATGGAYLEELFKADAIVLGAPMYNFSVPSQLKAWIDRIVVAGKTFKYGEHGPESLLPSGKKVYIASSRGGAYSVGSPVAALDHHETYLAGVMGFIGLTDIRVFRAEGIAGGIDARTAAMNKAYLDIETLDY